MNLSDRIKLYLLVFFLGTFFPLSAYAQNFSYNVSFFGVDDSEVLNAIKDVSQVVQLKKRPPASVNALRYRLQRDIPEMIRVLHAYSYYDASITTDIQGEIGKVRVLVFIHPGSPYLLSDFNISHDPCLFRNRPKLPNVPLSKLDISIGDPATSMEIVKGESLLLQNLAKRGYPLASIDSRNVLVNTHRKDVEVKLCVDQGPLSRFGPVTIIGLKDVDHKFIARKIKWKEGQIYSPKRVSETEKRYVIRLSGKYGFSALFRCAHARSVQ